MTREKTIIGIFEEIDYILEKMGSSSLRDELEEQLAQLENEIVNSNE